MSRCPCGSDKVVTVHGHDQCGSCGRVLASCCEGCGEVHREDQPCPDGTRWATGRLRCRMCGHVHVGVWPTSIVDEDAQECPECGHMTCEPIEDTIEGPTFG